jgi:serine protease Do
MRSCFAIPALAASLFLSAQHLPAQFNLTQSFSESFSGSRLGVILSDIDADRAAALRLGSVTGVEVARVEPGSPAEQAGIKAGDVLLSFNNESIVGAKHLGRLVSETPVGRKIKIEYSRDGKVSTVMVTTAARPALATMPYNPITLTDVGGEAWPMPGPVPSPHLFWSSPRIGIECEGLDARNSQLAEFFGVKRGVLVRSVSKDSAAAKAGLRAGDVILQISGHPVADPTEIVSYVREEQHSAKPMPLEVMRDHKPAMLKLSLESQE